jgi:deoxyribonuclease-4
MRVGAHVSAAGGVDGLLQRANSLGVEAAQFFLSSPRTWKFRPIAPSTAGETTAVALAQGVERLVVHASYLINLGSDDPLLATRSSDLLAAVMKAASADHLSAVVLHPGSHKGTGFDASLDRWFRGVEPGLGFASPGTKLLLENTAGGGASMGRSVDELRALLDRCARPDAVGICIDTQHLFAAGHDLRDRGVASELAAQLLSEFGSIPVVHLNDSATELGSAHDRHANLGEGAIGLEALVDFIDHEVFRSADIILEVPGSGDGPRLEDVSLLRGALKQRG